MFGWRAKIGLIVPSRNVVMEPEFNHLVPPGVSVHTSRMFRTVPDVAVATQAEMMGYAEEAAQLVAAARVNVIILGCTSATFIGGTGNDEEINCQLTEKTGVPAITTSSAVVEALHALAVRKITIVTPYIAEVNEREQCFLEGYGFSVLAIGGFGLRSTYDIAAIQPSEIVRYAKSFDRPEGEALFLSCTNLRGTEAVEKLERELKKPVISSNQASLWLALKRLNISDPIEGCGQLLRIRRMNN